MTTGMRRTHDFCWINVMSGEAQKAREFFGELLHWDFGAMPGVPGGQLILVGGRVAGALMDLDECGTPPHIGVMIKVDSADAGAAKVDVLGGKAEAPMDVLANGRMAMCSDPNGAVFALWQAKAEAGIDVDGRAHGAPTWFETLTSDADRAAEFYGALFGWTVAQQPMPEATYTLFSLGAEPIAGAMPILPRMGAMTSHWKTFFAVDDADAAARQAVALGGTLCMPVQDIPDVGRFGMLQSPQGVAFYILEYAR